VESWEERRWATREGKGKGGEVDFGVQLEHFRMWFGWPYCYFRLSVVFEITFFEIVMARFAVENKQIWHFST